MPTHLGKIIILTDAVHTAAAALDNTVYEDAWHKKADVSLYLVMLDDLEMKVAQLRAGLLELENP